MHIIESLNKWDRAPTYLQAQFTAVFVAQFTFILIGTYTFQNVRFSVHNFPVTKIVGLRVQWYF